MKIKLKHYLLIFGKLLGIIMVMLGFGTAIFCIIYGSFLFGILPGILMSSILSICIGIILFTILNEN